jgi:hypothetical protein
VTNAVALILHMRMQFQYVVYAPSGPEGIAHKYQSEYERKSVPSK